MPTFFAPFFLSARLQLELVVTDSKVGVIIALDIKLGEEPILGELATDTLRPTEEVLEVDGEGATEES